MLGSRLLSAGPFTRNYCSLHYLTEAASTTDEEAPADDSAVKKKKSKQPPCTRHDELYALSCWPLIPQLLLASLSYRGRQHH